MDDQIVRLFASKLIARPELFAVQRSNGDYNPVNRKITKQDLLDHLSGRATYGHYLLNTNGQCKVLIFDIDLVGTKRVPCGLVPTSRDTDGNFCNFVPMNCREVWVDRSRRVERDFLKYQLRGVAHELTRLIIELLEIPAATVYTGAKGLHVYGFTGLMDARDVRYAGDIIIAEHGRLEPDLGNHSFKFKAEYNEKGEKDPFLSFDQLNLEIYPKQTDLNGKTHGNLVRLPLGKNLKNPRDPTFFLDQRGNFGSNCFSARDPVEALTAINPFM